VAGVVLFHIQLIRIKTF